MFGVNVTFISSSEVKCIFHECRSVTSRDKHLNFLFIIYITFDIRDANLAFARGSLTCSFVPWTSTP